MTTKLASKVNTEEALIETVVDDRTETKTNVVEGVVSKENMNLAHMIREAVACNSHTKSLKIKVVPQGETIRLMGEVNTYFQKQMLITVACKVCPQKQLIFDVSVL